jgi:hypothetical protein
VDSSGFGETRVIGSCEHGNEHLGSIEGREFVGWAQGLLVCQEMPYSTGLANCH